MYTGTPQRLVPARCVHEYSSACPAPPPRHLVLDAAAMAAAASGSDERIAWANRMRLLLSPKGALNADGSIKQARSGTERVGSAQTLRCAG